MAGKSTTNLTNTFPLPHDNSGKMNEKLSQSLTMKSSPAHAALPHNLSSPLSNIRDNKEKTEPVNMFDFKDMEARPFEENVLKEMEERAHSRLSAYDNLESPDGIRGNKPFKNSTKRNSSVKKTTPNWHKYDLSKSYHSFSYGAQHQGASHGQSPAHHSLNASWQFYNFVGEENSADTTFNGTSKKPSQAIITINARTSLVLVANETACGMFGYTEEEMCGAMKMSQLFTMEDGIKQNVLIERNVDTDGNIVMASGKVLEAVDSKGNTFVVSVWMKRIQAGVDARCIVVMEPVEVTRASFLFNAEGKIEDCDFPFAFIHGYEDPQDVIGANLRNISPALVLPTPGETLSKEIRKQRVTSRTKDLVPFPSTIKIKVHDPDFHELYLERTPSSKQLLSKFLYKGFMWVFANVSGLVTVSKGGRVTSCNENFMRVFLGYYEKELVNKNITTAIPYFYEQIDMLCDESLQTRFTGNPTTTTSTGNDNELVKGLGPPPEITADDTAENSDSSVSTVEENVGFCVEQRQRDEKEQNIDAHESSPIKNDDSGIESSSIKSQNTSKAPEDEKPMKFQQNDDVIFKPGSHKKATIENTSLLKIECLDGFSPHEDSSSTPKQDDTDYIDAHDPLLTLPSPNVPERQKLEFESENDNDINHHSTGSKTLVHQSDETQEQLKTEVKTSDYESLGCSLIEENSVKTACNKIDTVSTEKPNEQVVSDASSVFERTDSNNCMLNRIIPGHYYGQARHKDGSMLPILFEIKSLMSRENEPMFCVWISRDLDEDAECNPMSAEQQQMLASFNTTANTSVNNFQEVLKEMQELKVDDPGCGPYNEKFNTVKCIGKGAFGFVNLAERNTNKEQVVVKFIRKEKVLKEGWISDPDMGRIPYEVHLLSKLQHPNIVKMLEAYENDGFFQVVMEKHGDGIDLFEFIDRKPSMDEALASYMFRQILTATDFLHRNKVLHRDIKDENIIVDRQFNLKLIDFGSAAAMEKGKRFNTFCGTMEYCSPEVLLGNKYEGPELEMWSLGVTLYTFIFGEHPFFEVEETIRAELFPPFKVSNELMFGICWMLNPEVEFRAKLTDLITYPWFTRHVDIAQYDYDNVLAGVEDNSETDDVVTNDDDDNMSPRKLPAKLPKQKKQQHPTLSVSSVGSCNSSLSSTSSSSSSESDVMNADSEMEQSQELMKQEYRKYLEDPKDITSVAHSHSF